MTIPEHSRTCRVLVVLRLQMKGKRILKTEGGKDFKRISKIRTIIDKLQKSTKDKNGVPETGDL